MADERVRARMTLTLGGQEVPVVVETSTGPVPVDDVVVAAQGIGEALVSRAIEGASREGSPVRCAPACDACCHHAAPVSPLEARTLARAVRAMPVADREAFEARLATVLSEAESRGLVELARRAAMGEDVPLSEAWRRAHLPCPFLVDRACVAYAARPLVCREYMVSSPPEACSGDDPRRIRRVVASPSVAARLQALSASLFPEEPPRDVLPLAVARALGRLDDTPRAPGIQLLQRLIGLMTGGR